MTVDSRHQPCADKMKYKLVIKLESPMQKIIIPLLAAATVSAASVSVFAQSCPEGQHYDQQKKKCVPHGG